MNSYIQLIITGLCIHTAVSGASDISSDDGHNDDTHKSPISLDTPLEKNNPHGDVHKERRSKL